MKLNHLTPAGYRQNPDQFVALFNKLIDRVNSGETTTVTVSGGSSYKLPAATRSSLGGVIVGDGLVVDGHGLLSATGTTSASYTDLTNKPSINGVTILGAQTLASFGVTPITNAEIDAIVA